jgi:hypothetical protein
MANNDLICSLCGKTNFDAATGCVQPMVDTAAVGDWFCAVTEGKTENSQLICREKSHKKSPLRRGLDKVYEKVGSKYSTINRVVCIINPTFIIFELTGWNQDQSVDDTLTAHFTSNFGSHSVILTRYIGANVAGREITHPTADMSSFRQSIKAGLDTIYGE